MKSPYFLRLISSSLTSILMFAGLTFSPSLSDEMRKRIEKFYRSLSERPEGLRSALKKYVDVYQVDGLFAGNLDLFLR